MKQNVERLLRLPVVRQLYSYRFDRAFSRSWPGAFRGVYQSFAEALASAPASKPIGYDNDDGASLYADRFERIVPADYPTMFWLDRALRAGARSLFDLGGHVGISFYGFRRYIDYPDGFRWTVYDVPAVRRQGQKIAEERGVTSSLGFADDVLAASGTDVLLAAGSLQYLERPLSDMLANMSQRPRRIIVNKTPLTKGPAFVTLQNLGTSYCPYRIFNDSELIGSIEKHGYRVRDRWENADIWCHLPLRSDLSIKAYSGVLFELLD